MTTPTPGDLSARLLAYATRKAKARDALGVPAGDYVGQEEIDTLCQAAATLSALPAAGGGDVLDAVMNEALRNGTGIMRIDPASIYTTPQPSALRAAGGSKVCPKCMGRGKRDIAHGETADCAPCKGTGIVTTTPQPSAAEDAAVGAQGDGDDRALIDAAIKMLRADGFVRSADAIRRLAAPAAGKGVDALPAKWRATSDAIAKPYGFVTEHTLGKAQALDACADELEAALTRQPGSLAERLSQHTTLTRQPVAGDGMGAGEREELERLRSLVNTPELHDFTRGVVLEGAHQRERWGNDHDAGKEPQDWFWLVGYLAGKALRSHLDGNTDKALHHTITVAAACANWHGAILGTHNMRPGIDGEAALAAPAAAPTDGGEGKNA